MPADYNVGVTKLSTSNLTVSNSGQGSNSSLTITLGSGRSFTWDGTGDNGQFLTSGTYFLEVESNVQDQTDQEMVLPVHIQNNGANAISGVVLVPNPVNLGQTTQARFLVNTQGGQVTVVTIRIYTVAGELKQTLSSLPGNPGEVDWDLSHVSIASGTYIAVAETRSSAGGVIGRHIRKIQIIH